MADLDCFMFLFTGKHCENHLLGSGRWTWAAAAGRRPHRVHRAELPRRRQRWRRVGRKSRRALCEDVLRCALGVGHRRLDKETEAFRKHRSEMALHDLLVLWVLLREDVLCIAIRLCRIRLQERLKLEALQFDCSSNAPFPLVSCSISAKRLLHPCAVTACSCGESTCV